MAQIFVGFTRLTFDSKEDRKRLLSGAHASHLCYQPTCISPSHIVVEAKAMNEARKRCLQGPVISTVVEGCKYTLPPLASCQCAGEKCILIIEQRDAVVVE
jgi:hypothetical protein